MDFVLSFLEGIISFISPCLLPMLPVYVIYFTASGKNSRSKTLANAFSFVLGFTVVFTLLGIFAGSIGQVLNRYHRVVEVVSGILIILLGLNFLGLIKIPFLTSHMGSDKSVKITGVVSSFLFGIIFSISWTPCVASFLGSALAMAAGRGSAFEGAVMLVLYSLGLGVPFILSALLLDQLKSAFDFIKRNYNIINKISGILLIVVGILFITGVIRKIEGLFL